MTRYHSRRPPARNQAAERVKARNKDQKRIDAEERQARYRKRKTHQDTVTRIEKEIGRLEARQKELAAELENPATYEKGTAVMQLNREWQENADTLKLLAREWEEAATNSNRQAYKNCHFDPASTGDIPLA